MTMRERERGREEITVARKVGSAGSSLDADLQSHGRIVRIGVGENGAKMRVRGICRTLLKR